MRNTYRVFFASVFAATLVRCTTLEQTTYDEDISTNQPSGLFKNESKEKFGVNITMNAGSLSITSKISEGLSNISTSSANETAVTTTVTRPSEEPFSSSYSSKPMSKSSNSPTLQEFDGKPGYLVPGIELEEQRDSNETDPKFLTFDEWKKVKLNENPGVHQEERQRSCTYKDTSIYKSESIGEDMEIDLGLFTSSDNSLDDEPEGKLYKDKFNYASLDCAATIVKTNSEASGANAILHENKDKYLLNPCSAPNKFVVIELCQDILVEEIAIANYEFFSSTFQNLRFSVSDRFPPKNGWKVLGEFEAQNSRNIQKFSIEKPMIWARYLRVEILSHYGDEFYCPISIVRVHGKTMIDEFKLDDTELKVHDEIQDALVGVETKLDITGAASEESPKSHNESTVYQCMLPNSLAANNMTILPDLKDDFRCPAVLPHLKFDEFLKDLNQSSNDPTKFQRTLNISNGLSNSYTEESIFKNIIKRLTLLESNATLSLLYIEEQSKLLSHSFSNLERSQTKKLETLADAFNHSIISNLESLSSFAKQLRESSLKILEEQKLNNDQFTTETLLRFEAMKKEAAFQKRLIYTTLFAFTALLVYILLTREAYVDEFMEDDGWYLNSPPLEKARKNLMRKTNRNISASKAFVFEATSNSNELDNKSDFSLSSSSASLYDDTKSFNSDSGSISSPLGGYSKSFQVNRDDYSNDNDNDDVDIDEIIERSTGRTTPQPL